MKRVLLIDFEETSIADPLESACRELDAVLDRLPTSDLGGDEYESAAVVDAIRLRQADAVVFRSGRTQRDQCAAILDALELEPAAAPRFVLATFDDPDEICDLLRRGVSDFVTPPFRPVELVPRLRRVLESSVTPGADSQLDVAHPALEALVGACDLFLAEVRKVPQVAACNANVFISGETGTGKEIFARAIHQMSPRAARPFVTVNCGAIPLELVENELFGHERGAYTGATGPQVGIIRQANGGTLFLDELDSLPLLAQAKLLRFLQDREFRPLGSIRTERADVRVITATNINVEQAVEDGRLRLDLYYRLNVIPLTLPPLRDRREDIPRLAKHFLKKHAGRLQKQITGFSANAMDKLVRYQWPGNVRQLEHVIERAVALAERSVLHDADVVTTMSDRSARQESFQAAKAKVVSDFERSYLESLLVSHRGNITRAAEAAHKNRRAFWELLRKHDIDAHQFRHAAQGA